MTICFFASHKIVNISLHAFPLEITLLNGRDCYAHLYSPNAKQAPLVHTRRKGGEDNEELENK